jgi:RND family efflux transporter MFP subunit
MIRYLLMLLPLLAFSNQIKVEHPIMKPLGMMVQTNARITQLSDQKQEIVSRLSGHVEAYYVKAGEHVKSGDKVVLIESIELSKRTADYLALKQQIIPAQAQATSTSKLYKKGLASKNELNAHLIALETLRSEKNALASQLQTLGVDVVNLTVSTDKFTLYAHADGVVGKILVSLHANVDAKTPLMTLVNQSGYYAIAFLSVADAMQVNKETKGWVKIAGKSYPCHFVQLLPNIDEETQRAKVRFSIEKSPANLLLGAFTQMEIALPPSKEVLMVKKSSLTLFKGEWVVFVEAHHEEHEEASHKEEVDEHEGHDHAKHEAEKEDAHDEHEEEEEAPYEARVVDIIAYSGDDVAVKGLELGVEYVSDGVYFVKSMLLKSSLGGHGH